MQPAGKLGVVPLAHVVPVHVLDQFHGELELMVRLVQKRYEIGPVFAEHSREHSGEAVESPILEVAGRTVCSLENPVAGRNALARFIGFLAMLGHIIDRSNAIRSRAGFNAP